MKNVNLSNKTVLSLNLSTLVIVLFLMPTCLKAQIPSKTKTLGGLTPSEALKYMKETPDLVIVEVNEPVWKLKTGFIDAMWIPHTQMSKRFNEIPKNRPVLIHCGGGVVSVPAYKELIEKRPDIPELSYIAGAPQVKAYNEWVKNKKK